MHRTRNPYWYRLVACSVRHRYSTSSGTEKKQAAHRIQQARKTIRPATRSSHLRAVGPDQARSAARAAEDTESPRVIKRPFLHLAGNRGTSPPSRPRALRTYATPAATRTPRAEPRPSPSRPCTPPRPPPHSPPQVAATRLAGPPRPPSAPPRPQPPRWPPRTMPPGPLQTRA